MKRDQLTHLAEAAELTDEQKAVILEAYIESLFDEGEDALAAFWEIRVAHGF